MRSWYSRDPGPRTSAGSSTSSPPAAGTVTCEDFAMNPRIFREYDIRGVADRDLDDQLVRDLGAVFARKVSRLEPTKSTTIAVGRDCRLHSPRLFTALTEGLRTCADVIDLGEVATPHLYFAAHHLS